MHARQTRVVYSVMKPGGKALKSSSRLFFAGGMVVAQTSVCDVAAMWHRLQSVVLAEINSRFVMSMAVTQTKVFATQTCYVLANRNELLVQPQIGVAQR